MVSYITMGGSEYEFRVRRSSNTNAKVPHKCFQVFPSKGHRSPGQAYYLTKGHSSRARKLPYWVKKRVRLWRKTLISNPQNYPWKHSKSTPELTEKVSDRFPENTLMLLANVLKTPLKSPLLHPQKTHLNLWWYDLSKTPQNTYETNLWLNIDLILT